jgi:DNA-binding transcriptional MerR regulator
MLSIGLFARVGGVTIQALRHYDRLGLLSPQSVDAYTGYRFYTLGQLATLHRILALKALGLSLEQIGGVLRNRIGPEQLRGMLALRRAQLEQDLTEAQQQLTLVEANIDYLEKEGKMSDTTVVVKNTEPIIVASASVRIVDNNHVVLQGLGTAYNTVAGWLQRRKQPIMGASIAVWRDAPDGQQGYVVEAAFPIASAVDGDADVQVQTLPVEQVAALIFQGDFANFKESYPKLLSWIERNGYRVSGACREVYHHFEQNNLGNTTVEIQLPVAKV